MKKTDFILIAIVLVVSAIAFVLFRYEAPDDVFVNVLVDGESTRRERLSSDASPIIIDNAYGRNVIAISSDGVVMVESDCASQTCVHTGKISNSGEIIACLPHRLLVVLEGGNARMENVDVISK